MELSDETGVLGSGSAAGGVNRVNRTGEGPWRTQPEGEKVAGQSLVLPLISARLAVCGMVLPWLPLLSSARRLGRVVLPPGLLPKGSPLGLHAEYKSSRPEAWERQRPTWPYLLRRLHATWTAVNERLAWE
jgi:hypothetical protein